MQQSAALFITELLGTERVTAILAGVIDESWRPILERELGFTAEEFQRRWLLRIKRDRSLGHPIGTKGVSPARPERYRS